MRTTWKPDQPSEVTATKRLLDTDYIVMYWNHPQTKDGGNVIIYTTLEEAREASKGNVYSSPISVKHLSDSLLLKINKQLWKI